MVSKSNSTKKTVVHQSDNRKFVDSHNQTTLNQKTEVNNKIDKSVRIDSHNKTEISNRDNHSINDAFNSTTNVDSHDTNDNSTNLGAGAINTTGNVSVAYTETDAGAIQAALDFAGKAADRANALSEAALTDAFKSTVGGIQDQNNKWRTAVSAIAIVAVTYAAVKG